MTIAGLTALPTSTFWPPFHPSGLGRINSCQGSRLGHLADNESFLHYLGATPESALKPTISGKLEIHGTRHEWGLDLGGPIWPGTWEAMGMPIGSTRAGPVFGLPLNSSGVGVAECLGYIHARSWPGIKWGTTILISSATTGGVFRGAEVRHVRQGHRGGAVA